MIEFGASFALYLVSVDIRFLDGQQPLIKRICTAASIAPGDTAKTATVFEDVISRPISCLIWEGA